MKHTLYSFEQILQDVQIETGISNLRNRYSEIKKMIANAEREINPYTGFLIRKKMKLFAVNGVFDGKKIKKPQDYVTLDKVGCCEDGICEGQYFETVSHIVICDGVKRDEITYTYWGIQSDGNGNPVTTYNHASAVVSYIVWKFYSQKSFLGEGHFGVKDQYKREFEDRLHEARGEDFFPSEEALNRIVQQNRLSKKQLDDLENCKDTCLACHCLLTFEESGPVENTPPEIDNNLKPLQDHKFSAKDLMLNYRDAQNHLPGKFKILGPVENEIGDLYYKGEKIILFPLEILTNEAINLEFIINKDVFNHNGKNYRFDEVVDMESLVKEKTEDGYNLVIENGVFTFSKVTEEEYTAQEEFCETVIRNVKTGTKQEEDGFEIKIETKNTGIKYDTNFIFILDHYNYSKEQNDLIKESCKEWFNDYKLENPNYMGKYMFLPGNPNVFDGLSNMFEEGKLTYVRDNGVNNDIWFRVPFYRIDGKRETEKYYEFDNIPEYGFRVHTYHSQSTEGGHWLDRENGVVVIENSGVSEDNKNFVIVSFMHNMNRDGVNGGMHNSSDKMEETFNTDLFRKLQAGPSSQRTTSPYFDYLTKIKEFDYHKVIHAPIQAMKTETVIQEPTYQFIKESRDYSLTWHDEFSVGSFQNYFAFLSIGVVSNRENMFHHDVNPTDSYESLDWDWLNHDVKIRNNFAFFTAPHDGNFFISTSNRTSVNPYTSTFDMSVRLTSRQNNVGNAYVYFVISRIHRNGEEVLHEGRRMVQKSDPPDRQYRYIFHLDPSQHFEMEKDDVLVAYFFCETFQVRDSYSFHDARVGSGSLTFNIFEVHSTEDDISLVDTYPYQRNLDKDLFSPFVYTMAMAIENSSFNWNNAYFINKYLKNGENILKGQDSMLGELINPTNNVLTDLNHVDYKKIHPHLKSYNHFIEPIVFDITDSQYDDVFYTEETKTKIKNVIDGFAKKETQYKEEMKVTKYKTVDVYEDVEFEECEMRDVVKTREVLDEDVYEGEEIDVSSENPVWFPHSVIEQSEEQLESLPAVLTFGSEIPEIDSLNLEVVSVDSTQAEQDKFYVFQFDNLTDQEPELITNAKLEDTDFAEEVQSSRITQGDHFTFTKVGRIGFAVKTELTNKYTIHDILGSSVEQTVFDRYFDPIENKEIFISKNYIAPSSIYYKFVKK